MSRVDALEIGYAIKDRRAELGMAQAELAEAAGVSKRCLWSLELGQNPGVQLDKLTAVLGCGDVDEDQCILVVGDQIDLGSLGGSPTGLEKLVSLALDEAGGCLDCLLLKFEIAHDDLRLFVAGPFGLPCDPKAAQVQAEGKEESETRQDPSFAQQKFFAPCLTCLVLSERGGAKEGEGGRPGRRGLCNGFRVAGWPTCYEREFEPKTIGLNGATRTIAPVTEIWFHRPLP